MKFFTRLVDLLLQGATQALGIYGMILLLVWLTSNHLTINVAWR